MDFINITPPFDLPDFKEMKKREATKYFNWFVEDIPLRIKLLREFYAGTGEDAKDLDLSPESLIKVWDWFMPFIKMTPKSPERIREEYESLPEIFKGKIEISSKELSFETLLIAHYVSIYYGEVFIQNNSELKWGFLSKPKILKKINPLCFFFFFPPFSKISLFLRTEFFALLITVVIQYFFLKSCAHLSNRREKEENTLPSSL